MTMRLFPDPKDEVRGGYLLIAEIDGKRVDATISGVALFELGCGEGDDVAAFVAEHEATLEEIIRDVRAKRPRSPVRVWADDVRRRETAVAGGGGAPAVWS